MSVLTLKQEKFAQEYLGTGNATEAASRAYKTQKRATRGVRNQLELTEGDIKAFVRDAKEMMEHPAEMLLNAENPLTQRALFGLVFETTPTYDEIVNGTPKLTWIFKLSERFLENKSQVVVFTLRGIGRVKKRSKNGDPNMATHKFHSHRESFLLAQRNVAPRSPFR